MTYSTKALLGRRILVSCLFGLFLAGAAPVRARVVINEIHYHPVEEPAFTAEGLPALDLSEDRHEFIELLNTGPDAVVLSGWRLDSGVQWVIPPGTTLGAGRFLVLAKSPALLAAVGAYGLRETDLQGPWEGSLSNDGETVRLRDASGNAVDSVSYSAAYPWPIGADGMGAGEDWTGVQPMAQQYQGRSLERVSVLGGSGDPANWVASPLVGSPSPGGPNSVVRDLPLPVVVHLRASVAADGGRLIRRTDSARIEALFSSSTELGAVELDYFVDLMDATNEVVSSVEMQPSGDPGRGLFQADLPPASDRSLVRYRVRAQRAGVDEVVSPRPGDPMAWHAYFVTPARVSTNRIYDIFVSAASLRTLMTNISANPRRVTTPDPPGRPRASWNATEPAVFVHDGVVYDVELRHHGSRYRRNVSRRSYKLQFPRFQRFDRHGSLFLTDKDYQTETGHALFREAGLPTSQTRWVDLYLNTNGRLVRLEQEEYDDHMLERVREEAERLDPTRVQPGIGELFKCVGFDGTAEGPYGNGKAQLLPARLPHWTALQRYEWTFALQNHGWKGHTGLKAMMEAMWSARGSSTTTVRTNDARTFFEGAWDVDRELTHLALFNWMVPWDDVFHNYFLWRQSDGRWSQLPWDFDSLMNGQSSSGPIYTAAPNQSPANFFKTTFIAAFRAEFTERIWTLNNTLLHPDNLAALNINRSIRTWATNRFRSVNTQARLGTFEKPLRPTHLFPADGAAAGPSVILRASAYQYSTNEVVPHGSSTWMVRSADGSFADPVFRLTSSSELTSVAVPADRMRLGERYYWRVSYTDTRGHPSVISAETGFVVGPSRSSDDVMLSEVMARNATSVVNAGRFPDWIELHNPTAQPRSLGGMGLTDDLSVPDKYVFPLGAELPPGGRLVVWCDSERAAPGIHTGFGLDAQGETIGLFFRGAEGWVLKDALEFGPQLTDLSVGRVGAGSEPWALNIPTPGAANTGKSTADPGSIRINEWMAAPVSGDDWIELYNRAGEPVDLSRCALSDESSGSERSRLPPLSFIDAAGFLVLVADGSARPVANRLTFRLSAQGGVLDLLDSSDQAIDRVLYGLQRSGVSEGRVPDGSALVHVLPIGTRERTNFEDTDGDGIPDPWEIARGLDPLVADGLLDSDGDGVLNGAEYRSGTSPMDGASRLELRVAAAGVGSQLRVLFTAEPGRRYTIDSTEDPGSGKWQREWVLEAGPTRRPIEWAPRGLSGVAAKYFRVEVAGPY